MAGPSDRRGGESGADEPDLLAEIPTGVFATDERGRCTRLNRFWEAYLGRPLEDLYGYGWAESLHPEDRERVFADWRRAVELGASFSAEYRFLAAEGETSWVLGRAEPLRDEAGRLTGFVGSVVEITDRKRMEVRLQQKQKLEAVGTLAEGIAHDFNNLLTAIQAGVGLGIAGVAPGSRAERSLRAAAEAAERAAELTQELLVLGRRHEPERRPTDISAVVERTTDLLRRSIPETIEVEVELDRSIPVLDADPMQLGHALLNLGINARDAIGVAGGVLRFETAVVAAGDADEPHVRISVVDSGVGIPVEIHEKVFEPFYTTKRPDSGSGLGLAMVHSCVRGHGGWIELESQPGAGSRFDLYLPLVPSSGEVEARIEPRTSRGDETVLLVDDTELVRVQARAALESCGYRVITAADGREAVQTFDERAEEIGLVVTDLVMPRASGRDVLAALRRAGARVPVVLMTGYADRNRPEAVRAEGFDGLLPKPFDGPALAREVRRALDVAATG